MVLSSPLYSMAVDVAMNPKLSPRMGARKADY